MIDLGIFLFLIAVGFIVGGLLEKRHYASIEKREAYTMRLPAITMAEGFEDRQARKVKLVSGAAVISTDYFKTFAAGIMNFFGGNLSSYESLLDRARREALLRMKNQAVGATVIVGTRFETAMTEGKSGRGVIKAAVFAYGTAIWLDAVRTEAD